MRYKIHSDRKLPVFLSTETRAFHGMDKGEVSRRGVVILHRDGGCCAVRNKSATLRSSFHTELKCELERMMTCVDNASTGQQAGLERS
jgi:hypothetical protein